MTNLQKLFRMMATLFLVPTTGCSGLSALTGSGSVSITSATQQAISNAYTATSCADAPSATPLTQWLIDYSNNSNQLMPIYWFAKPSSPSSFYIYTAGVVTGDWPTSISYAIDAWDQGLDDTKSGSWTIQPYETSNYQQAQVQVFEGYNVEQGTGGYTQFGTITGPDDLNYGSPLVISGTTAYLAGASITLNTSGEPNPAQDYFVSLHELGHSLGLAHNPKLDSVMFPNATIDTEYNCFPVGSVPLAADTAALNQYYDPKVPHVTITPVPCDVERSTITNGVQRDLLVMCKASVARMASPTPQGASADPFEAIGKSSIARPRVDTLGLSRAPSYAEAKKILAEKRAQDYDYARQHAPNVEPVLHAAQWWHGTFEGTADPRDVSFATLLLSSSLVAEGHATRVISATSRRSGTPMTLVQEFQVDKVLSAVRGAGETAIPGSRIAVLENAAYEDVNFSDDPFLGPNQETLLFLDKYEPTTARRAALSLASGQATYVTTAPMISKWVAGPRGMVQPLGGTRSAVSRILSNQSRQQLESTIIGNNAVPRTLQAQMRSSEGMSNRLALLASRRESLAAYLSEFSQGPRAPYEYESRFDSQQ